MMNLLPKSAWRYTVMMLLLLGVVAWASYSIISHIDQQLVHVRHTQVIRELSMAVWSLTLGVMFLTGAFGVWAIRSAVEIEGRRRIGRFVAAMDYLSDGLVLLDRNGGLTGFNPAFQRLAPRALSPQEEVALTDIFPSITGSDLACLLDLTRPREIERECVCAAGLRTLRFRSQPLSGVRLLLVSDVTDLRSQEMRLRQLALLQLVGRIAGGVAHDFNNILCAVSGHASLLERGGLDRQARAESLAVIQKETQKGALLSRQLLALSRSGLSGVPGVHMERHIEEAVALLRVALTQLWTVKLNFDGAYPAVPLTPGQIEQIILNLGLLAADALAGPGVLTVSLMRAGEGHLANVADGMAVVLLLAAEAVSAGGRLDAAVNAAANTAALEDEGGVILSVVSSMVQEVQGQVECLSSSSGACIYRVCLPHLVAVERLVQEDTLPVELGDYLAGWRVMLACASDEMGGLDNVLRQAGAHTERCENIMSLLGGMDGLQEYDALVIDVKLLGEEVEGLLRAVLKLCPRLGVLALFRDPSGEIPELKSAVAFGSYEDPLGHLLQLLIIAKALRAQRDEQAVPVKQ